MAGFSGAVKIADLTDYIAPSQDCIVIETKTAQGRLVLQNDSDQARSEIPWYNCPLPSVYELRSILL
jgi:hypothetical protein